LEGAGGICQQDYALGCCFVSTPAAIRGKMLSRGSEWRRWEPHIHAPGTVMNNQFSGPNAWHDYLTALEQANRSPPPAIGTAGGIVSGSRRGGD